MGQRCYRVAHLVGLAEKYRGSVVSDLNGGERSVKKEWKKLADISHTLRLRKNIKPTGS